ncbi:hypothetical protein [Photorhabdus heterorhabditis]|uniref:hypothetical protein n=1 Tax=Photorhabdus heterorhabditis TaxID=880156 RepID=UPI001910835C|nr:hypothetical protein [Photorhabdus heterorhabditis]
MSTVGLVVTPSSDKPTVTVPGSLTPIVAPLDVDKPLPLPSIDLKPMSIPPRKPVSIPLINVEAMESKIVASNGDNKVNVMGRFADITLGHGSNVIGHGDNDLAFSGEMGNLVFGKDISPERLWFQHEGQDLQISVIGSKQEVTLHNGYASPTERAGSIMAGDGHRLMDSDVEHLVQAMAAFAPPAPATAMLGDVEQQRLQPVLAANWH